MFGRYIRHCGWYPDKVLRLYPTKLTRYNDALVHEKVEVSKSMKVETLKGDLIHFTYNDMNHYLVKSAGYAKAWAEQEREKAKEQHLTRYIACSWLLFENVYPKGRIS